MITETKTKKKMTGGQIVAGLLPGDSRIEFIGENKTKSVIWLQHGCARKWEDLSQEIYQILESALFNDHGAMEYFTDYVENGVYIKMERKVELYIFYMCGLADGTPDLVDGILNFSENYRSSSNCPSLGFDQKEITIEGKALNDRELRIIDLMKEDLPDKAIAAEIPNRDGSKGITESTYNHHRQRLYEKVGVHSRAGLLQKVNAACI